MNGIGLDYQQTLTLAALREGSRDNPRIRLIDDGHRLLIPHAVTLHGLWGTEAFLDDSDTWLRSAEGLPAGPWLEQPSAGQFWERLYQRMYLYLGRLNPSPREGYQVVTAVAASPDSEETCAVLRHAERAGFVQMQIITVTDALLCRWLVSSHKREPEPKIVVVVALTDCAVCVSSYRLFGNASAGELPQYIRGGWSRLDGLGFRFWCDHLLGEVRQHLAESPAPGEELLLRDGALELASRLGRADRTDVLEWTGPLHERCFSPATFSARECQTWSAANQLSIELPLAVRHAAQTLGGTLRPDLLVLGGLGAVLPFVEDIAQDLGPTWRGTTPEHDIALGAAWWPLLGRRCFVVARPSELESSTIPVESSLPGPEASARDAEQIQNPEELVSNNIPPWERNRFQS